MPAAATEMTADDGTSDDGTFDDGVGDDVDEDHLATLRTLHDQGFLTDELYERMIERLRTRPADLERDYQGVPSRRDHGIPARRPAALPPLPALELDWRDAVWIGLVVLALVAAVVVVAVAVVLA